MSRHLMTSIGSTPSRNSRPTAARDSAVGLVLEARDPLEVRADALHAIQLAQRGRQFDALLAEDDGEPAAFVGRRLTS